MSRESPVVVGTAATALPQRGITVRSSLIEVCAGPLRSAPSVVRDPRLLMDARRREIYYAPFEYINPSADRSGRDHTGPPPRWSRDNGERALQAGKSSTEGSSRQERRRIQWRAAVRSNQPAQPLGLSQGLGLTDSADLFSTSRHLVQTTSLLVALSGVLVKGDDYRGSPDMTKHPC